MDGNPVGWASRMLLSRDRHQPIRYKRLAAASALAYLLLAGAWILLSGGLMSSLANSTQELYHLELTKGLGFVAVTSAILFVMLLVIFREIAIREETITSQQEALLAAERAAVAGVVSASVAHDLRNALGSASLALDEVRETDGIDAEVVDLLEQSFTAMNELCEDLLHAGRAGFEQSRSSFDLGTQMELAIETARHHPATSSTSLETGQLVRHEIVGAPTLLNRAIVNAIINAAEAGAHRIMVSADATSTHLRIIVDDDGPGLSEQDKARIFEHWFSTKTSGHGLGLSSILACADHHGGEVEVADSPLGGARFIIALGI